MKRKKITKAATEVQGEGDYTAAHRYGKDVKAFVGSHDVTSLARHAEPKTAAEARDLAKAESKGKSRSRGEDATKMPPPGGKRQAR